jgi:hypothetical protein
MMPLYFSVEIIPLSINCLINQTLNRLFYETKLAFFGFSAGTHFF